MDKTKQTPRKKEYDRKFRREKMLSIAFRLNKQRDAELIETYMRIPNKMNWFRQVLQEYADKAV